MFHSICVCKFQYVQNHRDCKCSIWHQIYTTVAIFNTFKIQHGHRTYSLHCKTACNEKLEVYLIANKLTKYWLSNWDAIKCGRMNNFSVHNTNEILSNELCLWINEWKLPKAQLRSNHVNELIKWYWQYFKHEKNYNKISFNAKYQLTIIQQFYKLVRLNLFQVFCFQLLNWEFQFKQKKMNAKNVLGIVMRIQWIYHETFLINLHQKCYSKISKQIMA